MYGDAVGAVSGINGICYDSRKSIYHGCLYRQGSLLSRQRGDYHGAIDKLSKYYTKRYSDF